MKNVLTIILTMSFITGMYSQSEDRREDFVFWFKSGDELF